MQCIVEAVRNGELEVDPGARADMEERARLISELAQRSQ